MVAGHLAIRIDKGASPPFRQITACRCATPSRLTAGPTIFCEKLAERGGIQHLLGQQFLQLGVLVLKLLQPLGFRHVEATVLGLPVMQSVASETPCLCARSAVFAPASCSKTPMICSSVNRTRFIRPSFSKAGL
jgi:hypothetical protein